MSTSIDALDALLQEARRRMLKIQDAIVDNHANLASCERNKTQLKLDIDDLELSLSILRKM